MRIVLLLIILGSVSPLAAQTFDVSRDATPTSEQEAEPSFTAPWGLWANRAPYPYYDGAFSMDTQDDLVARDLWIDFQSGLWLTNSRHRGGFGRIRARIGLFFLDVGYMQVTRETGDGYLGQRTIRDWSFITHADGHIGATLPIPYVGYVDAGIGATGFDETNGLGRVGLSFRASVQLFPIWPLGIEAEIKRSQFFDGTGVNDFSLRLHVQAFRHIFLTVGWRWKNIDGDTFGAHGFTFGFSFQFSNLRTFFWSPMSGPAF